MGCAAVDKVPVKVDPVLPSVPAYTAFAVYAFAATVFVTVKLVNVPRLVTFGCAAVVR